jgi:hypothetical protein
VPLARLQYLSKKAFKKCVGKSSSFIHFSFRWQLLLSTPFGCAQKVLTWVIGSRVSGTPLEGSPIISDLPPFFESAMEILHNESRCLGLHDAHCVVGDIHSNIDDLLRVFDKCGYPPPRSYRFLTDYVDRATNSCEVIMPLGSLKVIWPNHISLLRGNHEYTFVK